ncbi:MAG: hypothetical protein NC548_35435 [Lachnospiraceae bacterium]|nr:hypothetical protein [Lachnospiraceae bacterium]
MGTLGIKLDYEVASRAALNMVSELRNVCCDYNIDNVIVAGSLRRLKQYDIGDIDMILVTTDGLIHPDFTKFLADDIGMQVDAGGSKLVRALTHSHVQFDFYSCVETEFVPMLSYLTGSQSHNIMLRATARKQGYKLNQTSLVRLSDGAVVNLASEEQLYKFLGLAYVDPTRR